MTRLLTRGAVAGACIAMVSVGGMMAAYGPAIPALQERFGLSPSAAASGLSAQSLGAVAGVLLVQPLLRRRGNRAVLAGTLALIVLGAALIAISPWWTVALIGATVAGIGVGGCDALITQLLLLGIGRRGPVMVNVAHACFGLGTVVAPLSIAATGSQRYPLTFGAIAVITLAALCMTRGVSPRPSPADAIEAPAEDRPRRHRMLVIGGLLVLYIAHFAVQSGIGSWEPTRLIDLGMSPASAGLATSGYWLMMVIGRAVAAPLASRIPAPVIVASSATGMTLTLVLAFFPPFTAWAYLLAGLFIGPIFPNGLTWLASTGVARGSAFAYVIAGAMAGAVACPPIVGALIDLGGTEALAPALMPGAVLTLAAAAFVIRVTASITKE